MQNTSTPHAGGPAKEPRCLDRLLVVLVSSPPQTVELLVAFVLMATAGVLFSTSDALGRSATFAHVGDIAPQGTWALVMFLCGLGQAVALLCGAQVRTRFAASVMASAVTWVFAVGLVVSPSLSVAGATWVGLSVAVLWATWRLKSLGK